MLRALGAATGGSLGLRAESPERSLGVGQPVSRFGLVASIAAALGLMISAHGLHGCRLGATTVAGGYSGGK